MKKISKTIKTSGNKLSFVFFGSGPVAAKSLRFLLSDFEVEAIVTKSSTKAEMNAISARAIVYTVDTKKELDALIRTQPFVSSLGVLVDFGIIVSQEVIDYFPHGIVNSHFSLLPEWRGADPITFSVLSGQTLTGVSLMLIAAGMDEGPLLSQSPYAMPPDTTTPTLTEALIEVSYVSLREILPLYLSGVVVPRPQDTSTPPTFSRKLTKEDGIIDWHKPAQVIEREIRAYLEWPKSRTTLAGKDVIITRSRALASSLKPGKIVVEDKAIVVGCGQGSLVVERLKPAGKTEMTSEAFLAGHKHLL